MAKIVSYTIPATTRSKGNGSQQNKLGRLSGYNPRHLAPTKITDEVIKRSLGASKTFAGARHGSEQGGSVAVKRLRFLREHKRQLYSYMLTKKE